MKNDLELKLLKDTIFALREELEKAHNGEREHIQQAVSESNAQIRQLRANIIELRDQLELREALHEQKVQEVRLQKDHEIAELHQTIAALRERLEELNESNKGTDGSTETTTAARTSH